MLKLSQKKTGIVLQYAQMGLSILISFIYTPIMLNILGATQYGIYSLSSSIISYLSLLSLGFSASYIRFYSRYAKEHDQPAIAKLNGLFLITFTAIGLIALLCGGVLVKNTSLFFNNTYTSHDLSVARVLMAFMTFNLALSFPVSVFISYISAQEQFIFQKLVNMFQTVIGPFLTLPVLLMGWGSIGMVVVTTAVTLIVDAADVWFCLKKLKMNFIFSHLNFDLLKEIAGFSIFIAINQLIDQINWTADKVILGKVCSGAAVAVYAIGAQINGYFVQFSTAISGVFIPQIHRIENEDLSQEEINQEHARLMAKVGRIQFLLLMLILSGFVFFGKFFILKWAGPEYGESYTVALLLIVPVIVPLIQNVGIEIQRAKNRHQFRSLIYLFMAFINIGLSILFAKFWGASGAALGTTISIITANILIMNIYYHKALKIDMAYFWKEILSFVPSMILPFLSGILMDRFFPVHSILQLIVSAMIYTLIYAVSVYFLGLNDYEKELLTKPLARMFKS